MARRNILSRFSQLVSLFVIPFLIAACIQSIYTPSNQEQGWPDLVEGIRLYEEGRFSEAADRFVKIIERYPGSPLLKESQWLLAKSYLGQGEKSAAVKELDAFLKNYPNSPHEEEGRGLLSRLRPHKKILAGYWFPAPGRSLREEIPAFRQRGIDTIILPVYDNKAGRSGLYFKGTGAPLLEDRLQEWIDTAHLSGMRVVAKMPLREMNWALGNPEWRDRRYESRRRYVDHDKLDLFHPQVKEMVFQLYRDLTSYPVDGIYIDESTYEAEEGWTESALGLYSELFHERIDPAVVFGEGSAPPGEKVSYPSASQLWRWLGWRSRFLSAFLKELRTEVQSMRSEVEWGIGISETLLLDPRAGLVERSQDLLELKQLNFDFYVLISKPLSPLRMSLYEALSKYGVRPDKIWFQPPVFDQEFLPARLRAPLKGWVLLSP